MRFLIILSNDLLPVVCWRNIQFTVHSVSLASAESHFSGVLLLVMRLQLENENTIFNALFIGFCGLTLAAFCLLEKPF